MAPIARPDATEGVSSAAIAEALTAAGYDTDAAHRLVDLAGQRLKQRLLLKDPPLTMSGGKITANNIAGIIPLAPRVEIDVAPKFLGTAHKGWREDFFAVAALTGQGGLLNENVSAGYGRAPDLSSLLGRAFVGLFVERQRRPLRQYRRERWREWTVDGELVAEGNLLPDPDGFAQTATIRDRRNTHNALIAGAADLLITEVGDPLVRSDLVRVRANLGLQSRPNLRTTPLPGRHRHWEPLIELSRNLLEGAGLDLRTGSLQIPGFVVKAWQAWQTLLERALRRHHAAAYRAHQKHQLGTRNGSELLVNPDGEVLHTNGTVDYLVDAKYKASVAHGKTSVASADTYEALAFAKAAQTDLAILAYPHAVRSAEKPDSCGSVTVFQRIEAQGVKIVGIEVEVRGIGQPRAFADFSLRLGEAVAAVASASRSA